MRPKEFYEKKLKDGKLTLLSEIVCPYCFAVDPDPMAYCLDDDGDEENDVACQACGELMDIEVRVEKTYTTKKVDLHIF